MTTVNFTLYFSRHNGDHPFLVISTIISNKAGNILHKHTAMVHGEYKFERRELWEQWQKFKQTPADFESCYSERCESCRYTSITKSWEG